MLSVPKLLIIVLVLAALYYLFFRKKKEATEESPETSAPKGKNKKPDEIMVECAKCGTFVSGGEAILKDGRNYCSKECAGIK